MLSAIQVLQFCEDSCTPPTAMQMFEYDWNHYPWGKLALGVRSLSSNLEIGYTSVLWTLILSAFGLLGFLSPFLNRVFLDLPLCPEISGTLLFCCAISKPRKAMGSFEVSPPHCANVEYVHLLWYPTT